MPAEDLLLTKLMLPRLHASLIQRPGLFARLDQGLDKHLTLITAPTGYGKTSLVSLWLKSRGFPAAWLTLDEGDNDPARFWRYVASGFRQINPEIGKSVLALLRASQQPSLATLITLLINELTQLPALTLLVLDDIHAIHSSEVIDSLTFLIEHLPPNLHAIAMTRSLVAAGSSESAVGEVDWPVELLRARGELNELRASDLRFSTQEIEAFLKGTLPEEFPTSIVKRLEEKTEGWPAGIRLVTLAMQGKNQSTEQVVEAFNGEHRFVLAYLRKEVFDQQPEAIRTFLLQTCFLNRLTGSLCDWITGRADSAALLEQMEDASLFVIPLGSSRGQAWYRYQALFAEAMRRQAAQVLGEPALKELSAKSSLWYEQQGMLEEAVAQALAAGQTERAAHLIEQFIEQRSFYEILILLRWCELLPEEVVRDHPLIAFNFAIARLFSSDRYAPSTAASVLPLLEYAENAWLKQENEMGVGQALAAKGIVAWWQGDYKTGFQLAHEALEKLPENELLWRSTALLGLGNEAVQDGNLQDGRVYLMEAHALSGAVQNIHSALAAINILAEVDYLQGEGDASTARYQQVLLEATGGEEMLDDQSIARLGLSRIAYEHNDLRAAEEQAQQAVELGLRRSNEAVWVPAAVHLAWIRYMRQETGEALTELQALQGRIRQEPIQREVWLALARLSLAEGDLVAARRWRELIIPSGQPAFASQREQIDLLDARLFIAEGAPGQALARIKPWQSSAMEQSRLRSEITTLFLEALALNTESSTTQAVQRLATALSIAQPKGFRRIFIDEGTQMAKLLQSAIPNLSRRGLAVYATALLHSFPARVSSNQTVDANASTLLVEPLSPQEIRVLRLIAAGRSNPEIAEEMVVSVNTIKTQVQSIYRKLNVNSRDEARAAARTLSLI